MLLRDSKNILSLSWGAQTEKIKIKRSENSDDNLVSDIKILLSIEVAIPHFEYLYSIPSCFYIFLRLSNDSPTKNSPIYCIFTVIGIGAGGYALWPLSWGELGAIMGNTRIIICEYFSMKTLIFEYKMFSFIILACK